MAGKVFFSVTMSLDGFIAPEEHTRSSVSIGPDYRSVILDARG